jgi:hypothetical protein
MTTNEMAGRFLGLLAEKKEAAAQALWSDDIVSIEAFPGERQVCRGREAMAGKHKWWNDNMTVHGIETEGPFVNGDQFSARFAVDFTSPDGKRQTIVEMALYTVKDGAIVEERFFPLMAA